ncbi:hypothetical protein CSPX01_15417, partial [Colletotrichum filicis]
AETCPNFVAPGRSLPRSHGSRCGYCTGSHDASLMSQVKMNLNDRLMSPEFVAPIGRHCLITPLVASVTVPDAVVVVHIHNLGPNQANTASSSPEFLVCVALRIVMHFERFRSLGSRRQLVSVKRPTGYARKQVSTAKHRLLGFWYCKLSRSVFKQVNTFWR